MTKSVALKWLKQALHDLEMAEKNIMIEGFDVCAFLSHQSVEKLLKALFVLDGRRPPKVHYLDELGRGLALTDDLIGLMADLEADYTFARYPDIADLVPYEAYTADIAKEKLAIAKKIFDALRGNYADLRDGEHA